MLTRTVILATVILAVAACGGGKESQSLTDVPATATQRPTTPTTKATARLTASPSPALTEAPVLDLDDMAAAILNLAPYYTHTSDQDQHQTLEEVGAFFGMENVNDADILTFHSDVASDTQGNVMDGLEGAYLFVSLSFIDAGQLEMVPGFIDSMRSGGGRDVAMAYINTLGLPGPTTENELQAASGLGDAGWGLATETRGERWSVPFSLLYFSRGNVIVVIMAESDALLDAVAIGRAVDEEILRLASQ